LDASCFWWSSLDRGIPKRRRSKIRYDKWDHGSTDGEVFDVIKNGVAPDFNMIPWKDKLKDLDVWNVVNYLRSIAKKK
jgi:hypothetical protein